MKRRNFLKASVLAAGAAVAGNFSFKTLAQAKDDLDRKVLLQNFPLFKQETPYTCGPASVRMCLAFLGHKLPEEEIASRMHTSSILGTAPWYLLPAYNKYLKEFNVGLIAKERKGKDANNQVIFDSIRINRPVIFNWMTENCFKPGTAVGHYSVVIGFDQDKKEFAVADPCGSGSFHPLGFEQFWHLAAWSPKKDDLPGLKRKPVSLHLPPDLVVLT